MSLTFTLPFVQCRQFEPKVLHDLSGKLHLICEYTSIAAFQACNTFPSWDGSNFNSRSKIQGMSWYGALCKDNLHFCDYTINAVKHTEIKEQHMLP